MCGLAGIFSSEGVAANCIDWVNRMNKIQEHRGPDDVGVYQDNFCILGHRRLSIIDLSADGHQPFQSDDGRFQLVYNGEIYNYIELRDELKLLGWQFRTKTDTEVLLKAYLQYGEKCLSKFNGMFAFAIYDTATQRVFLARDRVGIKPLYYVIVDSILYFASEIKALLSLPILKPSVNHQSLFDYLVFNRTDIYDETFFSEIKRIPKGCFAHMSRDGLHIRMWWNAEDFLKKPEEALGLSEITNKISAILRSAVKLRMRSDVPVGSCLSGGLDSAVDDRPGGETGHRQDDREEQRDRATAQRPPQ